MTDPYENLKSALADRYTIERELGAGGMATVYLAHDIKHDRKVAVKVLRPELAAALGPERFLNEIRVTAKLNHPHILPLLDSGSVEEHPTALPPYRRTALLYYVMPYVEGESLRERIAKEGELPISECVRIVRDVVDALAEAHSHGVVHRDVKPDNVMLKGRHALVTDFGVAKAVSESTGRQQLTTAGVALGTPAYMAPEQATAESHIDHRADIYAVGALAYELLTGRPPFTGATQQEVLAAHVTQSPEPVTSHRDAVSPALAQLVMKCLEKKPADRWQTAEEMLQQLEVLATPSGGMTPTQAAPAVTGVLARTRMGWLAGAIIVAVVAVTAIVKFVPQRDDERSLVEPTRLTANPLELSVSGSAISPDGQRVAYVDPHGLHLLTVSTNETRLVPIDDPIHAWNVWWYPDNENLLVLGGDSNGIQSLWSVSMFGGAARRIHRGVYTAAVAPDGSAIAVIRGATDRAQSFREIWVMGPRGEDPYLLATAGPDQSYWKISWTPDATAVSVGALARAPTDVELYSRSTIELIDVSSKERRSVLRDERFFQAWHGFLPIGWCGESTLVYSLRDGPQHQVTSNIWIADVDLADGELIGEPRRLTQWMHQNAWNLSVSDDCSRIVVQRLQNQADVFVAELNPSGTAFVGTPRQVTFDEREDHPGAWTDDAGFVLVSARTGKQGLFRERAGGDGLESLIQTDGAWLYAAYSRPDSSILYLHSGDIWKVQTTGEGARRLVEGGDGYFYPLKCSLALDGRCVAGTVEGDEYVFYSVDPISGETAELGRTEHRPPFTEFDISPDGRVAAVVHNDDDKIVLVDFGTGEESHIVVEGYSMFEFIAWTAQGDGFFINPGENFAGGFPELVHVDMNGRSTRLIGAPSKWYLHQMPSPDGRYLAFASMSFHANAWLIEGH